MNYNLNGTKFLINFGNKIVYKKSNAYIEDLIINHYYPKVLIMRNKILNLMNSILIK